MISQAILVKLTVLGTMMLLITETNSAPITMAACRTSCGNLTIPFPFGTSSDCNLDDSFLVTCNHSYDPPKPFLNLGSIEVLGISLNGQMKVASSVASDCYDESGSQINGTISELTSSKFPISSTQNKFTAVGCDTYALIEGSEESKQMSAGCISWCDSIASVVNGTCSGIGCCQTSIPKGIKDFLVDIRSFRNHTRVKSFNPCGYAFVVENEAFAFTSSDLKDLMNRKTVPTVLDWSVGNMTCQEARRNLSTYACRAIHSECSDSSNGIGYNCNCLTGFQGNPYIVHGCEDIDECYTLEPCQRNCKNLQGSYLCSCPKGFEGDGKKDGTGCHSKSKTNGSTLFYITSGFMIPAVGSSWIFWRRKQKKVVKLRKNLFMRNGGLLLENMLSGLKALSIFTAEDIKMATNNYDQNNLIPRNDMGFSYKGILQDGLNRKVIIKTILVSEEWDIEVFISKLFTLSQIHHRNVIKLIGCCLETPVPLLVYEFVTIKTLFDYIHVDSLALSLIWDIRLRIAAETAETLAYVHSAASVPIIHGNLNSSSILLTHGYTVKVDDFALVPESFSSASHIDPESLSLGILTVKTDVYSFGVILAELLTGKENVSDERPEGEEFLAKHFVSSLREGNLIRILDNRLEIEGKIEQLTEVAKLAEWCLSHSSFERPTMKEVAMALESAINLTSSSKTTGPNSSITTTARRVVRRNRSF
ncbi:hypothetical protein BUALT_Bualt08G0113600 [Buddleja alternifolia]|uniref:Non-specific serine/threonine protein kinase n=1 Tax=Buddleja alternifolia TaxID=168488 RepID=A0AAV6XGD1_9LAMI|nr:hypothetical protein BUALT_Bualt08G0113600 [Buddleja alternifolia]